MKIHYKKETEYTGIPNWWRGSESLGYPLMAQENTRLMNLYPSIWVHISEVISSPFSYEIRILFNKEEDEAAFILRELE